MEQSPTISIEQDSSSITISRDSSEKSLHRSPKFEKWHRITKRIIRFFRYINIPILRLRFLDMIRYISIEDLKSYDTRKVPEDLAFLHDVKRYREVFNTFSSFGFLWQDKEFRLAKLKATYIHDRYMSTSDALAKTNIPPDTIPVIANRMNSPRIFPSLTYLNLFNDAEKFLMEKLLMIYARSHWNGLEVATEKPISLRDKGNRIPEQQPVAQSEHMNSIDQSIVASVNTKPLIDLQPDEILIPNWTYSTSSGVVYNPIREKSLKTTKKAVLKKTKTADSNPRSPMQANDRIPNDSQQIHPKFSQHLQGNPSVHLSSSPYSRCDHIFHKNMFDKHRLSSEIFICKIHSSSNPSIISMPYRMALPSQFHHLFATRDYFRQKCLRSIELN